MLLDCIIWHGSPILLHLGKFEIRWYGLLFALGFLLGSQIMSYIFQKEERLLKDVDILTLHIVLGTIIGARLGNVLFYEFSYFSQHPLEIFLPVVFEPKLKFIGYQGFASHGAAIGILVAIYIYVNYSIDLHGWPPKLTIKKHRRAGQSYLWITDRLMIVVALAGCLIRIGNFMNSEVIGKPTHSHYGVLFVQDVTQQLRSSSAIAGVKITKSNAKPTNDSSYLPVTLTVVFSHGSFEERAIRNFLEHNIKHLLVENYYIGRHIDEPATRPLSYELSRNSRGAYVAHINTLGICRHPAQLYESFSCLVLFFLLFYRWSTKKSLLRPGEMLGLLLVIVFGLRVFYELFKESKVAFAGDFGLLRVPQLLSLPLLIAGILLVIYSRRSSKGTG